MSFARPITPANRIREQIDLRELIQKYGMNVPLEFTDPESAEKNQLAICAYVYVFSGDKINEMVMEIIQRSIDETFAMLKRRMNYEEQE